VCISTDRLIQESQGTASSIMVHDNVYVMCEMEESSISISISISITNKQDSPEIYVILFVSVNDMDKEVFCAL